MPRNAPAMADVISTGATPEPRAQRRRSSASDASPASTASDTANEVTSARPAKYFRTRVSSTGSPPASEASCATAEVSALRSFPTAATSAPAASWESFTFRDRASSTQNFGSSQGLGAATAIVSILAFFSLSIRPLPLFPPSCDRIRHSSSPGFFARATKVSTTSGGVEPTSSMMATMWFENREPPVTSESMESASSAPQTRLTSASGSSARAARRLPSMARAASSDSEPVTSRVRPKLFTRPACQLAPTSATPATHPDSPVVTRGDRDAALRVGACHRHAQRGHPAQGFGARVPVVVAQPATRHRQLS